MAHFDLLEDFLAFLHATDGNRKKSDGAACDLCGAALELDPDSGEERCPECDDEG